jgi:hypothetical protein
MTAVAPCTTRNALQQVRYLAPHLAQYNALHCTTLHHHRTCMYQEQYTVLDYTVLDCTALLCTALHTAPHLAPVLLPRRLVLLHGPHQHERLDQPT